MEDDRVKTIAGPRHNLDETGNFKHPFLKHANVEVIAYPDIGAFSTRLTEHTAPIDELGSLILNRAIGDTFVQFTNYGNSFYTAPMYLGAARAKFDLLYDTGSPEVTLGVSTCTGCNGKLYDVSTSATFQWTGVTQSISYYDGTKYDGERCKETTCPINNAASCMTAF
jgi:hypothetical protein